MTPNPIESDGHGLNVSGDRFDSPVATSPGSGGGGGATYDGPAGGDGTGVGDPAGQGFTFNTVLNAVNDLGMDNTGGTPIDSALANADADNTLIEFPVGEYVVDNEVVLSGNDFGLRGLGDSRRGVRIGPNGNTSTIIINYASGNTGFYMANLALDQSGPTGRDVGTNLTVDDKLYIYNVETYGFSPNNYQVDDGDCNNELTMEVHTSGGTALVENYQSIGECDVVTYQENSGSMRSYRASVGNITVRNARIENKGEHAYYASRTDGAVKIDGGLFRNNANTNARLSGSGSYIQNATIAIDKPKEYFKHGDEVGYKAVRGLWWESGDTLQTGGRVTNCDFILKNVDNTSPGLIRIEGTSGAMDIENCRLRNETDNYTVYVGAIGTGPGSDAGTPPTPHAVNISGTAFTGSTTESAVDSQRDSAATVISNCCLGQSGGAGFTGAISESGTSYSGCARAQI